MTESEMNEAFNAITGAGDNAELAAAEAPEAAEGDPRKDGLYYHATVGGSQVHYEVVVDHRVVALVRVSEDIHLIAPEGMAYGLREGTTFHPISLMTPSGTFMIPTEGVAFKAPDGILNRTGIKSYVLPKLPTLLVRLYNLGA